MKLHPKRIKQFGQLVGSSKAMKHVYTLIEQCASLDYPVLIEGETGTGKELVANEIHQRSRRSKYAYLAINLSALTPELCASELFGHEKGSFTGALARKLGLFEKAEGGSLFLDEIITMDDRTQLALLRVLENRTFRRVGGHRDIPTNVRIIASANKDINEAMREKRFRSDLLYRLKILTITLPPLRERTSDIPMLAYSFLTQVQSEYEHIHTIITDDGMDALLKYPWPGNVRELRNVIYQAAVLAEEGIIDAEHIGMIFADEESQMMYAPAATAEASPMNVHSSSAGGNGGGNGKGETLPGMPEGVYFPLGVQMQDVKKQYVQYTLKMTGQNKSKASSMLGISRRSLYDMLK
ncbi:AAA domain-containing protein [bacterium]|nr:AAA domain-containing protein [bacterium]